MNTPDTERKFNEIAEALSPLMVERSEECGAVEELRMLLASQFRLADLRAGLAALRD